ncbi:MAG: GspH/FimT family pseudopilin [Steroidobacteraceae bacterium]|nr:GspH/FimT family pseudopilin [Nevskiaceae bacterium]MCP5338994.1 GspH/FimT family pseudopilin [Nevskiaceae bacterium]MCP5359594.1 GspH/FimT family pseudopilin [Nevskiaceae bacterium]
MGHPEQESRSPGRRARAPGTGRIRGFTLVELLIVIVIAALVLAIGAPQFSEFRRNSRLAGASNDLLAALQQARTEAIKRQRPVALCGTTDPTAGDPACAAGSVAGWIVFEDGNADCQRSSGDPPLIRREGPIDQALHTAADGSCVVFAPTGFTIDLPDGIGAGRILICDERGTALQAGSTQSAARGIAIARTGRASITRDPDTLDGWGLSCG